LTNVTLFLHRIRRRVSIAQSHSRSIRINQMAAVDLRPLNLFTLLSFILVLVWNLHYRPGASTSTPEVFQWHPILMTVCFGVCLPQASVMFRRQSLGTRVLRKNLHAGMQLFGLTCAVFGLVAVLKYHNDLKILNWYSLHSWLGLAAFVTLLAQWVLGVVFFSSLNLFPPPLRTRFMPVHMSIGTFLLIVSTAALTTGILEKNTFSDVCFPSVTNECKLSNLLGLCSVATCVACLTVLAKPKESSVTDVLVGDAETRTSLISGWSS